MASPLKLKLYLDDRPVSTELEQFISAVADLSDKLAVSAQMADRGIMTRNEIREIWNLPPVEGGDVPTIRGEYYLINDDGTITKENGDSAEEGTNGNE